MNSPLISIIVPNYNGGEFIALFIDSVKKQTYKKWELIFVDDGSTDNSMKIINDYMSNDTRIKVYVREQSPKGACACRNIGFDLSVGKYVCFFDSDDLLPSDSLENRIKEFEYNPNIDFVVSPAISFKEVPYDINKLVLGIPIFKNDLSMFLKRYRLPFGVWTNTYKREFLQNHSIKWDSSLASLQDSDFNIQTLQKNPNYSYSKNQKPVYYWRVSGNPNSITKKIKSKNNLDSQIYFFTKLKRMFTHTKEIKSLNRFGLTILLRCAYYGYNGNIEILVSNNWDILRYNILKIAYKNKWISKLSLVLNLLLFPIKISDEYIFIVKNRIICRKYFKLVNSKYISHNHN